MNTTLCNMCMIEDKETAYVLVQHRLPKATNSWCELTFPEIISHGTLLPKQAVKGFFDGVSVPVNPELSTIFLQLHISERTGRGIPKIINAYNQGVFAFGENTFSVILPYERLDVKGQTPQVKGQTPQVKERNNRGKKHIPADLQERILQFCNVPKTIMEIVDYLGLKDRKDVRVRGISPLVEQGRLAMTIPQSPNSRFQKYITIK